MLRCDRGPVMLTWFHQRFHQRIAEYERPTYLSGLDFGRKDPTISAEATSYVRVREARFLKASACHAYGARPVADHGG